MTKILDNINPPKQDLNFLINLYKNGKLQDVIDKSGKMLSDYSSSLILYNLNLLKR